MEALKAILFGIVEGITEWLPVSSTAHLILLNEWLRFDLAPEREAAFMELYDVVIQLGAILALVVIHWYYLWPFGIVRRDEIVSGSGGSRRQQYHRMTVKDPHWNIIGSIVVKQKTVFLWLKIALACVPGFLYGVLLDDMVEALTEPYQTTIIAVMLILVGLLFIIIENHLKGKKPRVKVLSDLTWQTALIIGLAQVIAAALPGTSRSGATIIAGLLLGLSRGVATTFTFYLAVPTMAGASLLKLLKYVKGGMILSEGELQLLMISCVTAFLVSLVAIQFMTIYIGKNKDFKPFGWYRIVLGAAVLLYFTLISG